MKISDKLFLVPPEEAKIKAQDTPTDNLSELYILCKKLEDLSEANDGVGLAASQVGIRWRLFVVKNLSKKYDYYLNCNYEGKGEKGISVEGCLSLKGKKYKLERFAKIRFFGKQLVAKSRDFKLIDIDKDVEGLFAVIFQHECDHSAGIIISDLGEEIELY